MIEKLKEHFGEMLVFKDLKKSNVFSSLGLPAFLRDWLLKEFCDSEGNINIEEMKTFIQEKVPRKADWSQIKNRIVYDGEHVIFLGKIVADTNIKTGEISFSLPDFGLGFKDTIIFSRVWDECKDCLGNGVEVWGILELGYCPPDGKTGGKVQLLHFSQFQPYEIDVEFYKEKRKEFTVQEWIDVVLGAIDYNPDGYSDEFQKLAMLQRLLPFVEKRLNLIELAPKGTGKSYVFGHISKFGLLTDGGRISRAKMFYDLAKQRDGFIVGPDYVAIDEVKLATFSDVNEMRSILQGYMEYGSFNIGGHIGEADAGIVFLGNISKENMDEYTDMFAELPDLFRESALIDRIHGFIRGWDIPRMDDGLKLCGWALNSEYFCTILHILRNDPTYRAIVDQLIVLPEKSDTRDTEAIKRLATAYMKLLFPNVQRVSDISVRDFKMYCLRPAMKMRGIIKRQLGIIDTEFAGKDIPALKVKEIEERF